MTIRTLIALGKALASLDGSRHTTDGKDTTMCYDFDPKVRVGLAMLALQIETPLAAFRTIERELLRKYDVFEGMEANEKTGFAIRNFHEACEDAKDTEAEIGDLPKFRIADLLDRPKTDDKRAPKSNPIPQSVLNALAPVLETIE